MISYRVPLEGLKVSTNKIYAGIHWTRRKEIKDGITTAAGYFCRPIQKFGPYPIEIRYRFIFGSKPLDTTNCTFLVKMFEDAFRALGILEEDTPTYVVRTVIEVAVLPKKKRSKNSNDMGAKEGKKNEDWLEVTAIPCNYISFDI